MLGDHTQGTQLWSCRLKRKVNVIIYELCKNNRGIQLYFANFVITMPHERIRSATVLLCSTEQENVDIVK